jgi:hypothetical protein
VTAERIAELLIDGLVVERIHDNGLSAILGRSSTGGDEKPVADAGKGLNKKVNVFVNRLLLRLFSVPALMTYLADVMPVIDNSEEGAVKVQLDFLRLPDEVIPQLERLIAAPHKLDWYQYVKEGSARTGVEFKVHPDDLEGADYDYAF